MKNIKESIFAFKDRLVNIGSEEPLSKLSLFVIIALDIFILSVVFQGLNEHTKQITSPDEYVPYECQEVFIRRNWSSNNFLTKLQPLVLSGHNNYSYKYDSRLEQVKTEVMHNSCREFYTKVKLVAENQKLKNLFIDRQETLKQRGQLNKSLNQSKDVYDTSLLENIADPKKDSNDLTAVKTSITSYKSEIEVVTQRLINTEKTINGEPLITELRGMLSPDNKLRQEIVNDFKKFQKVYPLKELGWQLVFMLPLFFVFYIWSSRSVKKNSKVQTLIATHLLVVASIPIILKVMEVVLDLIPLHFFKNLFKLLKSLHIIAIWHYVVILISVCATLFAVYVIQKKIFNKKRIQQKRLMKGACYSCGRKLPNSEHTCPFCGTKQQTNCHRCHEKTYVCGDYCKNCGTELLNQEINKK
jgi:hypothetical protein